MSLPVTPNTTCDIYRASGGPPAAPDVAGVVCYLEGSYERRMATGQGDGGALRFTHVMLVPLETDIRDGYDAGSGGTTDFVYVPDKNGTPLVVRFVERKLRGTANDHKKVYLDRKLPSWPSSDL